MGDPAAASYNRSMKILVRAVISGFGFSLGAALFKKISDKLGLGDDKSSGARNVQPDPESVASESKGGAGPGSDGTVGTTGFEGI